MRNSLQVCTVVGAWLNWHFFRNDLERHVREGDTPVPTPTEKAATIFGEFGCLGMQPRVGGKLHLKLNTSTRPIEKMMEGMGGKIHTLSRK